MWILVVAGVGLVVGIWLFSSAFSRGLKFSDDFAAARRRPSEPEPVPEPQAAPEPEVQPEPVAGTAPEADEEPRPGAPPKE